MPTRRESRTATGYEMTTSFAYFCSNGLTHIANSCAIRGKAAACFGLALNGTSHGPLIGFLETGGTTVAPGWRHECAHDLDATKRLDSASGAYVSVGGCRRCGRRLTYGS
jgi:hypothetical protein